MGLKAHVQRMECNGADMDAKTAGSVAAVLGPFLAFSILLMICRIPLSWYPNLDVKKLPWSIAVAPTEPLLGATRRAIPPVGGVDVAPVSCPLGVIQGRGIYTHCCAELLG
jgi:uncharacterized protein YggT (Ycf19 family)